MKSKNSIFPAVAVLFPALIMSSCVVATPPYEGPPVYSHSAQPSLVPMPGTYMYYTPGIDVDMFFYRGYWYRPYRNQWYSGRSYNGPWTYIPPKKVPGPVLNPPSDFRRNPGGYRPIPHQELERNWERWEKDRRWDSHKDWRDERRER